MTIRQRWLWTRAGPRAGSNPVLHVSPALSQAHRAQFTVTTACWSVVLVRAGKGMRWEPLQKPQQKRTLKIPYRLRKYLQSRRDRSD